METIIKPCPFCGGKGVFSTGPEHCYRGGYSTQLFLGCQNCYAEMSTSFGVDGREETTEEEAKEKLITNWNQRPESQPKIN